MSDLDAMRLAMSLRTQFVALTKMVESAVYLVRLPYGKTFRRSARLSSSIRSFLTTQYFGKGSNAPS
jgi:hypothetical protein